MDCCRKKDRGLNFEAPKRTFKNTLGTFRSSNLLCVYPLESPEDPIQLRAYKECSRLRLCQTPSGLYPLLGIKRAPLLR